MLPIPTFLYHASCPDGFGAAFAAWLAYKGTGEYVPISYGESLPDLEGARWVYMLDWTPPPDELTAWLESHPGITQVAIVDHHATAQQDYAEYEHPRVKGWIDLDESGATMAWQYFHGLAPMPELFQYIRDRDLWKWELPDSEEINEAIRHRPFNFEVWKEMMHRPLSKLAEEGKLLVEYKRGLIQKIIQNSFEYWIEVDGRDVKTRMVNSPYEWCSDVAHAMLAEYDCDAAIVFRVVPTPQGFKWTYSVRTLEVVEGVCTSLGRSRIPSGVTAEEIARKYGGGGHPQAAGFQISSRAPWL